MRITKRRRTENKTDYKARLMRLKSQMPRIVVRKTNKYILVQHVQSEEARDKVLLGISSKELLKHGWEKEKAGSLKSIPAGYLTGLLLGIKIHKKVKEGAILDLGMIRNVKKSRIYAVLNGLVDAGVKIKHKKEIFPEEKRIRGEHLKNKINFEKIKENILKEEK